MEGAHFGASEIILNCFFDVVALALVQPVTRHKNYYYPGQDHCDQGKLPQRHRNAWRVRVGNVSVAHPEGCGQHQQEYLSCEDKQNEFGSFQGVFLLVFVPFFFWFLHFLQRKTRVYYDTTDENPHNQIQDAVPENPELLSEYETHESAEEDQEEDVSDWPFGGVECWEGEDEDIVDEVGDESDDPEGGPSQPHQIGVEAEYG